MMQVLGQAIEGAKSTEQKAVGEYIRTQTFDTIVGKVKFGSNGEWEKPRVLLVQYQNIKGTDISQFAGPGKRVVLLPETLKSGSLIYPYAEALK
jgi:branched-chain amino acid transport system substrate-binding protein